MSPGNHTRTPISTFSLRFAPRQGKTSGITPLDRLTHLTPGRALPNAIKSVHHTRPYLVLEEQSEWQEVLRMTGECRRAERVKHVAISGSVVEVDGDEGGRRRIAPSMPN